MPKLTKPASDTHEDNIESTKMKDSAHHGSATPKMLESAKNIESIRSQPLAAQVQSSNEFANIGIGSEMR